MNNLNRKTRQVSPVLQVKFTAENLRRWMNLFADSVRRHEKELTLLDAALGDADHGENMCRGLDAVERKLDALPLADVSGQMRLVAVTVMSAVGGAGGSLYGAFFLQSSHCALHKPELGLADLTAALEAGVRGVMQLGKSGVGDKTMVDPLAAATQSMRSSCNRYEPLPEALKAARKAAWLAADGTIPMVARKGRAATLGDRSAGTKDPGAASAALLFETLEQSVAVPNACSLSRLQSLVL
jgi:dihydroxyacetone kinase-like protein